MLHEQRNPFVIEPRAVVKQSLPKSPSRFLEPYLHQRQNDQPFNHKCQNLPKGHPQSCATHT